MGNVFYSVLPIFLIALLGSLIRRKWITSDEFWRGLEKLSFYLLFPALLIQHISRADFSSGEFISLTVTLLISTSLVAVFLVIYQIKTGYNNVEFSSIFLGSIRYNNYIFFALADALFGDNGLTIVSTISPYTVVLTNTVSVIVFAHYMPKDLQSTSHKSGFYVALKSVIMNPLIIASIIGFLMNYFQIELNYGIKNTITSLADASLTVGIIVVGAGLKFRINPEHFRQVLMTSSIKLILMPIVTFIILQISSIGGAAKSIGILYSCLPSSSSSYILSRQLGGNPETISAIITFTTVFSVLSLSILVYALG